MWQYNVLDIGQSTSSKKTMVPSVSMEMLLAEAPSGMVLAEMAAPRHNDWWAPEDVPPAAAAARPGDEAVVSPASTDDECPCALDSEEAAVNSAHVGTW